MGEFRCTVIWLGYRLGMKDDSHRSLDCSRAKHSLKGSDSLGKRYAELVRLRKEVEQLEARTPHRGTRVEPGNVDRDNS
jgi:hypothetical protein